MTKYGCLSPCWSTGLYFICLQLYIYCLRSYHKELEITVFTLNVTPESIEMAWTSKQTGTFSSILGYTKDSYIHKKVGWWMEYKEKKN